MHPHDFDPARGHCGNGRSRDHRHAFPGGFRPPHGFGGLGHHGGFGLGRVRRGDVRSAILRLLAEQPMHGYQIIQELSNRSGGAWRPSAGSVYPTLQLLADEGLVNAEESGGKKVFSLTEAGTAEVASYAEQAAPWDEAAESDSAADLRHQMPKTAAAVWQIAMSGDADKVARATEILAEARKKLYEILAED